MTLPLSLENMLAAEIDPAFARRARFILESIAESRPKRVLDAGCGRGFYPHALTALDFVEEIVGIDVVDDYIAKAKRHCTDPRIKIEKASIYSLPYPDNHFDAIISSEVMEHLEHPYAAIHELKRVLRPDGMLLLSVPHARYPFCWDPLNWTLEHIFHTHVSADIWWLAGIWADHKRLYSIDAFKELAMKSGLEIEMFQTYVRHCWPFSHFALYAVGKNIVEHLLGGDNFSRFNFERKRVSEMLARFMRWPTKWDHEYEDICMNLAMRLKKII